ncbi:unnamed protein product [Phytophthora fragariaefolia]|uniref:Unnamed protein product n=1 Tax=Phytophthora fragariaefolia TaxID=1490495 RepID=A0A9W6YPK6_9STRA|nr:unnamed protein product [Phytophthora fragariaefolia]
MVATGTKVYDLCADLNTYTAVTEKKNYEMVYGTPPNVKDLSVWGSVCFAHIPAVLRKGNKLSARAVKFRFLGMSEDTKGHRLWNIYNKKHMVSRDVLFDTIDVANMVRKAFRSSEPEDTSESAAREPPAEINLPATESTGAVGATTLVTKSTGTVGASKRRRVGLVEPPSWDPRPRRETKRPKRYQDYQCFKARMDNTIS